MTSAADYDYVLRHVYGEPKARAVIEYMDEYPSPMQQMLEQVGRQAADHFVETGQWPNPDQRVTVSIVDDRPDFDWWEPRYDQPWRRQYHRDREAGFVPTWPSSLDFGWAKKR